MPELCFDLTKEVSILEVNDPEAQATIEEALGDIDKGHVYTLEEVRATIAQWHTFPTSNSQVGR
ncbi:MAG: hypothetical protein K7J46_18925 [Bryobacter sp.]|jgi:predicted transcriptional regulator|nr:hypothetical protein [Bryobacter sp. CoA8 C33]